MRRHFFVLTLVFLAGVAACEGCSKKPAVKPRPKSLYVDVMGVLKRTGEFEARQYRIDGQTVDISDTGALRGAIRLAKQAAAAQGGRELVVEILTPSAAGYAAIMPAIYAAWAESVPEMTLACLDLDETKAAATSRPAGERFAVSGGNGGSADAKVKRWVRVRIRASSDGKAAAYDLTDTSQSAGSPEELGKLLAGRKAASNVPAAALLDPGLDVRADALLAAITQARAAGLEGAYFQALDKLPGSNGPAKPAPPPSGGAETGPKVVGPAPQVKFSGAEGTAWHVVYLIDRSGSMATTFDQVREALIKSISSLKGQQEFHIVFFGGRLPIENPPRQLIPASPVNKLQAIEFLKNAASSGITQPVPAIHRAFQVLGKADKARPGKLIYMLTDGDFSGEMNQTDNEGVLKALRERNPNKEVKIVTLLFGQRTPEGEKVLKTIAADSGGTYQYVQPEE